MSEKAETEGSEDKASGKLSDEGIGSSDSDKMENDKLNEVHVPETSSKEEPAKEGLPVLTEPIPEIRLELVPEIKPEPITEVRPEPEPELKPEPVTEPDPDLRPEPVPELGPEPIATSESTEKAPGSPEQGSTMDNRQEEARVPLEEAKKDQDPNQEADAQKEAQGTGDGTVSPMEQQEPQMAPSSSPQTEAPADKAGPKQANGEKDSESGSNSAADNSSVDLNLSISSFLTKNKETGSVSIQVSRLCHRAHC